MMSLPEQGISTAAAAHQLGKADFNLVQVLVTGKVMGTGGLACHSQGGCMPFCRTA